MNWIKQHIKVIGMSIIAIVVSLTMWLIQPVQTIPSWILVIVVAIGAVVIEILINEIPTQSEIPRPYHRILAIRPTQSGRPIIVIKPSWGIQRGDILTLYRRTNDFEEVAALCLVNNVQSDGKAVVEFLDQNLTLDEQRLVKLGSNSAFSHWVLYSRASIDSVRQLIEKQYSKENPA